MFYNAKGRRWEKERERNLQIKTKRAPKKAAQNQREGASPSPSEGGDVRGYGGIWVAH